MGRGLPGKAGRGLSRRSRDSGVVEEFLESVGSPCEPPAAVRISKVARKAGFHVVSAAPGVQVCQPWGPARARLPVWGRGWPGAGPGAALGPVSRASRSRGLPRLVPPLPPCFRCPAAAGPGRRGAAFASRRRLWASLPARLCTRTSPRCALLPLCRFPLLPQLEAAGFPGQRPPGRGAGWVRPRLGAPSQLSLLPGLGSLRGDFSCARSFVTEQVLG